MDQKKYNEIKGFVFKNLIRSLHERHLEDCTQHVAMEYALGSCTNYRWAFLNYLRDNGIGRKGRLKLGAMALENSLSLDAPNPDGDGDSYYLVDRETKEEKLTIEGILEEFLMPLNLKKEIFQWVTKVVTIKIT